MPVALRERLGQEPTLDLVELLNAQEDAWGEHVLSIAAERFERRLGQTGERFDRGLSDTAERFERRLTEEIAGVRVEMSRGEGRLRGDIATAKVEILRWSFLFWIGQVAAMAGMLAFMLRAVTGH